MELSRRKLLAGILAGTSAFHAGCSTLQTDDSEPNSNNILDMITKNIPTEYQFSGRHTITYLSGQTAEVLNSQREVDVRGPTDIGHISRDVFFEVFQANPFEYRSPEENLYRSSIQQGDTFIVGSNTEDQLVIILADISKDDYQDIIDNPEVNFIFSNNGFEVYQRNANGIYIAFSEENGIVASQSRQNINNFLHRFDYGITEPRNPMIQTLSGVDTVGSFRYFERYGVPQIHFTTKIIEESFTAISKYDVTAIEDGAEFEGIPEEEIPEELIETPLRERLEESEEYSPEEFDFIVYSAESSTLTNNFLRKEEQKSLR